MVRRNKSGATGQLNASTGVLGRHTKTISTLSSTYHDQFRGETSQLDTQQISEQSTTKRFQNIRGLKKAPQTFLSHHLDPYYYEPEEKKKSVPFEQMGPRLWSRINPAYSTIPQQSEYQRQMALNAVPADSTDRSHFIRVESKAYKEAMAREANLTHEAASKAAAHGGKGIGK